MSSVRQELGARLEQGTRLVVTRQLRQALTILQLPTLALVDYLQQETAANPLLELELVHEEPGSSDDEATEREWLEYWFNDAAETSHTAAGTTPSAWEDRMRSDENDWDEAVLQIRLAAAAPRTQAIAVQLLAYLDDSGFLSLPDATLASCLGTTEAEVAAARRLLQSLEPAGWAWLDLSDYLCGMLARQGELDPVVEQVVQQYLEPLASGQLQEVAAAVDWTEEEMEALLQRLRHLPRPGGALLAGQHNYYIWPDVIVRREWGDYSVIVNDSYVPRVGLNRYYLRLLQEAEEPEVRSYIKQQMQAAQWLLQSLQQRRQTLHAVALGIIAAQYDFLEHGVRYLRPLTRGQIADSLGIHESTVSRAVAHKYMQLPCGMYPMRFFFTSGVVDAQGQGVAKESVQYLLQQLIETEDRTQPLSDQMLADRLQEQGISISRRTVSKYRTELGILSSRQRKRFYM